MNGAHTILHVCTSAMARLNARLAASMLSMHSAHTHTILNQSTATAMSMTVALTMPTGSEYSIFHVAAHTRTRCFTNSEKSKQKTMLERRKLSRRLFYLSELLCCMHNNSGRVDLDAWDYMPVRIKYAHAALALSLCVVRVARYVHKYRILCFCASAAGCVHCYCHDNIYYW